MIIDVVAGNDNVRHAIGDGVMPDPLLRAGAFLAGLYCHGHQIARNRNSIPRGQFGRKIVSELVAEYRPACGGGSDVG